MSSKLNSLRFISPLIVLLIGVVFLYSQNTTQTATEQLKGQIPQAQSKPRVQLSEDASYPSPVIKLQKMMAASYDELDKEKAKDIQLQETLQKLNIQANTTKATQDQRLKQLNEQLALLQKKVNR